MTEINYPHICISAGGDAHIGRSRYKVAHLAAEHYHYGWSAEELLRQHPDLQPQEVYMALAFFYDHYDEMVKEMLKEADQIDARRDRSPALSRTQLLARKATIA